MTSAGRVQPPRRANARSGGCARGRDREPVRAVVERLVRVRGAGLVPAHPVPAHVVAGELGVERLTRSWFLTGSPPAVFQPLRFQPAIHFVIESSISRESVTMHTRLPAGSERRPSSAAVYSIRLFVVCGAPPDSSSCSPSGHATIAAQPPGPGIARARAVGPHEHLALARLEREIAFGWTAAASGRAWAAMVGTCPGRTARPYPRPACARSFGPSSTALSSRSSSPTGSASPGSWSRPARTSRRRSTGSCSRSGPGSTGGSPPASRCPSRPGDHVVFPASAGVWVEVEEEKLLVCRVGELLGVLETAEERRSQAEQSAS